MIHNESKKWFLYSNLPEETNKLIIYMEARNCPECEKALEELAEYLKTRLDTIGKVHRIDVKEEYNDLVILQESYGRFPIILFDEGLIEHELTDIVARVASNLPEKEFEENIKNSFKALKNGKDLL